MIVDHIDATVYFYESVYSVNTRAESFTGRSPILHTHSFKVRKDVFAVFSPMIIGGLFSQQPLDICNYLFPHDAIYLNGHCDKS